jgi:hypothetical protein
MSFKKNKIKEKHRKNKSFRIKGLLGFRWIKNSSRNVFGNKVGCAFTKI